MVLAIDALLLGADGGLLSPLLSVLMETLQLCNFEAEVVLTGPRELVAPVLVKAAEDSTAAAKAEALVRVMRMAGGSPLPVRKLLPPAFALLILPPATK